MPERGTIDVAFIMSRMQEEYHAEEKKLCMRFVNIWKDFDGVLMKVLNWAMRK